MKFYNALLYTLLFSTVFSASHASKSSFADENEYPAIQTNKTPSMLEDGQKLEMKYLKKGMEHFTRGQYYDSNIFFERAIKINGSPLGYLYTSMMNFGNEKHRCFRIAKLSVASNALDEKTFKEHLKFLTQKKFKIPARSLEKKS